MNQEIHAPNKTQSKRSFMVQSLHFMICIYLYTVGLENPQVPVHSKCYTQAAVLVAHMESVPVHFYGNNVTLGFMILEVFIYDLHLFLHSRTRKSTNSSTLKMLHPRQSPNSPSHEECYCLFHRL